MHAAEGILNELPVEFFTSLNSLTEVVNIFICPLL